MTNNIGVVKLIIELLCFLVLMFLGTILVNRIHDSPNKLLSPQEYLPEEEVHSLRQISYLVIMGMLFADVLYMFTFVSNDFIYMAIFDIILSLYIAVEMDKSTIKGKILLILLIPYGALTFIIFGRTLMGLVDIIHIPVLIYFIKVYYDKFREYTQSNGLGMAVILLFAIVFISFFTTQLFERVNPIDALAMVSNAFTSNGYAVLGSTIPGKLNSIFLVWGGYLLSGVGTATLTAGILMTHFNSKFDEINEKLDKLEESNREK